jgi:hypothetical protein
MTRVAASLLALGLAIACGDHGDTTGIRLLVRYDEPPARLRVSGLWADAS